MKTIVNLTLLGLLIIGASAQCRFAYEAQVVGFPPGFCIELCSNPLYLNCPATPIVPITTG